MVSIQIPVYIRSGLRYKSVKLTKDPIAGLRGPDKLLPDQLIWVTVEFVPSQVMLLTPQQIPFVKLETGPFNDVQISITVKHWSFVE